MLFVADMLVEGVPGLSVADTREYLQFVADQRLVRLGLPKRFGSQEPVRLHGAAGRAGAVELLRAHRLARTRSASPARSPSTRSSDFHKQNRADLHDFAPENRVVRIIIEGRNLPGRRFEEHANVHVGLQERRDPVGLVPGDAPSAQWALDVAVVGSRRRS